METVSLMRVALAFLLVLGLIGLSALAARKCLSARLVARQKGTARLAIQAQCYLDSKRRLVLVRRDQREHLLLLSVHGDRVIETSIPMSEEQARG